MRRDEDRRRGFNEGVFAFGLIEAICEILGAILEAVFSGNN